MPLNLPPKRSAVVTLWRIGGC